MRLLAQLSGLSLLSLSLVGPNVAANPLPQPGPVAAALPLPTPVAQSTCVVPCSDNLALCCATTQHCAVWGTRCADGAAPDSAASANSAASAANAAATNGNVLVWTSVFLVTGTSVQTITSVYSSVIAVATPNLSSASGAVVYPTLRPSVSGDNTFLVPMPSGSSSSADFNYGGIIGTNSPPQGLTSAQIGGIVGGILGAFFLIALILLCCCMRRGPLSGLMGSRSDKGTHASSHSSSHGNSHGLGSAAAVGGLGYLFGRKAGRSSSGSASHHVVQGGSGQHVGRKTGMAALLGSAAGGLASLFVSRQKSNRMSEKYSTTDISSGYYTSDVTSNTYTSTSSSDSSSSSSSENSSSSGGHPHHGRH